MQRDTIEGGARTKPRSVHNESLLALNKGYGVCFNSDAGTAIVADVSRDNNVEVPSNANNLHFAGVIEAFVPVDGKGRTCRIIEPGSVGMIYVDAAVDLGDIVTCIAGGADAGKFSGTHKGKGFLGRGSARVLQTKDAAGLVLAKLLDGEESGLIEILTIGGADGGAKTFMAGGVTVCSAGAVGTANATVTIADAKAAGLRKAIYTGTLTGNTLVATFTNGYERTDATGLVFTHWNTITMSAGWVAARFVAGVWVYDFLTPTTVVGSHV